MTQDLCFFCNIKKNVTVRIYCNDVVEYSSLPHGIKQRAFLCDSQQLVWHGHVVGHRLLAIVEKGIRGPDLAGHQVVETQYRHGALEL